MTNLSGGTLISADVTKWSMEQRMYLCGEIDKINAQVGSGPEEPSPQPEVLLPEAVETSGWTLEAYQKVMVGLLSKHFVQAAVIAEAIKSGAGYVTRDQVYAIGNYPDSRTLKGFTRPVNRVTSDVVDAGLLPEDAEELLRPDYDPDVKSFQRAKGFFVPMEVVKLALEKKTETALEA